LPAPHAGPILPGAAHDFDRVRLNDREKDNPGCFLQRRACALIGLAPRTYYYVSSRGDNNALRERLRTLAGERDGSLSAPAHTLTMRGYRTEPQKNVLVLARRTAGGAQASPRPPRTDDMLSSPDSHDF